MTTLPTNTIHMKPISQRPYIIKHNEDYYDQFL